MLWLISVLFLVGTCADFKVTVPASRLVGVRGQPIILGCEFTPDSISDLFSLVVTWQRKEDTQVVHSFYYNQDQLDRQSIDYRNRTALFPTELQKGNASLRIEAVGPKDVGQYLCLVSNSKGTDKAQVQLEYGAFYTEPRLSISSDCSSVTVQYEAKGFPKPEVIWLGDQGQNLSHHTEITEDLDRTTGLYYIKSSYVTQSPALNITFMLKNPVLNQLLQRPVSLAYGDDGRCGTPNSVVTLSVFCSLFLFLFVTFMFLFMKQRKTTSATVYHPANQGTFTETNGHELQTNTNGRRHEETMAVENKTIITR